MINPWGLDLSKIDDNTASRFGWYRYLLDGTYNNSTQITLGLAASPSGPSSVTTIQGDFFTFQTTQSSGEKWFLLGNFYQGFTNQQVDSIVYTMSGINFANTTNFYQPGMFFSDIGQGSMGILFAIPNSNTFEGVFKMQTPSVGTGPTINRVGGCFGPWELTGKPDWAW